MYVETDQLSDSRIWGSSLIWGPVSGSAELLSALLLVYPVGFN